MKPFIFSSVIFALLSPSAHAGVYYCSPTGSDTSGNGTQTAPWRTMAEATQVMPDNGSTLVMLPGVYDDADEVNRLFSKPMTIESQTPYTAMLTCSSASRAIYCGNTSNVTFSGLNVYGTSSTGEYLIQVTNPSTTNVTFSNSSSQTSIVLTGVDPDLAALTLSSTNYTLSGGSLTLQSTTGTATVKVSGGTQTIDSSLALTLAGTADMVVLGSSQLRIAADIGQGGGPQLLLKDGPGKLVLSGTNSYGGTDVAAGTLLVTRSFAIPGGTSLTVDAGGTFIFDPSASGAPAASLPSAGVVAAVPEPALALLIACLVVGCGMWGRKGRLKG